MQTENWGKVKDLLNNVLEIEPFARQAFLNRSQYSSTIINEVNSLLAVESDAENLMNLSAIEFSKEYFAEEENTSLVGQQIGIYQIIDELGYGGMGAVYLAERTDGKFSQKVAIKILKREFNLKKFRLNFDREKEILSKLIHSYIARLLDAGTTEDGIPFLVMEFIEGISIDDYCEQKNLDLEARLKVFNKVCEAVSFSHQNLIVHRDIKPSNILVTDDGTPKLLDFGISKILNDTPQSSLTMVGAMTVEYASPEQIKGNAITTATDIYSLGVVLTKILTKALPYNLNGKTNTEIFKIITESEPIYPSIIIEKNNKDQNSAIAPQKLKGDLDNIVLKSLNKETDRRYQSVEQFSADIWRFIDGLPVSARPATFFYQASKFIQRNKLTLLAAVLIFLSLISGTTIAVWQAKTANEQALLALESKKQAEINENNAKIEAEKAKKVSQFMFKIFSYANPAWYAEGNKSDGQAKVIDILNEFAGKIETEFAGQTDIQAELHHRFGEIYANIYKFNSKAYKQKNLKENVMFHLCKSLELRRQYYGEWHELVAKDMYFGQGCLGKNEQEYAAIMVNAITMMRETNPNNINFPYMLDHYANRLAHPLKASVHEIYYQAIQPTTENKNEIAEKYYREALPIFHNHYKENSPPIVQTSCNLAYVLAIQDKWSDFKDYYEVCKQGEAETEKRLNPVNSKDRKPTTLEEIDKLLVEKGKLP